MVLVYADEYEELQLMADNAEQVEEHLEQAEYRYAQQQSMIDALKAENAEDEAALEALKKKAESLKEQQEADEARRQRVIEQLKEKKGGDKGDN